MSEFDLGIRHKSGATQYDFIKAYTDMLRQYAYATHDNTWGQLEKQISHVLKRMVDAEEERDELKFRLEGLEK